MGYSSILWLSLVNPNRDFFTLINWMRTITCSERVEQSESCEEELVYPVARSHRGRPSSSAPSPGHQRAVLAPRPGTEPTNAAAGRRRQGLLFCDQRGANKRVPAKDTLPAAGTESWRREGKAEQPSGSRGQPGHTPSPPLPPFQITSPNGWPAVRDVT